MGASVSFNRLSKFIKRSEFESFKMEGFQALLNQIRFFANNQIRDCGTVGGGLATASYLSDMIPVWITLNASIKLQDSIDAERIVSASALYKDGVPDLRGQAIVSLHVPFTRKLEFVRTFKQGRRRHDTQALVNSAMRVHLSEDFHVQEIVLSFGGLGKAGIRARRTEDFLKGREWTAETFSVAEETLNEEFPTFLTSKLPKEFKEYQMKTGVAFFYQFFHSVRQEIAHDIEESIASSIVQFGVRGQSR